MEIQQVQLADLESVTDLVRTVSAVDVLPNFSEQGKGEYRLRVLPDTKTTFNTEQFYALKIVSKNKVVGFGALRDGNYLTHLFISKEIQGSGMGKQLLAALLASTQEVQINLRSSVNAVSFYQSIGFVTTDKELEFNGIRFVPMSLMRQVS
ncbi:GNAT family N-acetyltransferase [Vibrio sp. T187]|uniref:GNAT family N-acetyltransferase n=1 Tax=Vibrio TaxID=662 RepID=UPI0010C9B260|nr:MULTISPECIES: GNAT family N-acetyltransferase [Vibrio]MBW3696712.1 GNAT family N-acetyltransferase [Vibrio sp. T187]